MGKRIPCSKNECSRYTWSGGACCAACATSNGDRHDHQCQEVSEGVHVAATSSQDQGQPAAEESRETASSDKDISRMRKVGQRVRNFFRRARAEAIQKTGEVVSMTKHAADKALGRTDEDTEAAERREMEQAIKDFSTNPTRSLQSGASSALHMLLPLKHQATVASLQPRLKRYAKNADIIETLILGTHQHSPLLLKIMYAL